MDGLLPEEKERKRKREREREIGRERERKREKDEGKSKRKRPRPKSRPANKAGALLSSNECDEPTFKRPKDTIFFSLSLFLSIYLIQSVKNT
jgi:hypothetical protein